MSEKETRTRRITDTNDPAIKQVAKAEAENFSEPMSESCIKSSLSSPHFGLYVYEKGEKVVCHVATAGVFPEMQINSLEVRVSNNAAKALYEKLGFTAVGTRKKLYDKPVEDGLEMITELQKNACLGN